MHTDRNLVALTLALTVCPLVACDTDEVIVESSVVESPALEPSVVVESPAPQAPSAATKVSAAGHIEVASVLARPWIQRAMSQNDKQLEACAKVFENADAITFGVADKEYEVYITGQLDLDEASACGDKIDGDAERPTSAVVLDEDLFVLYRGEFEPSRARLADLLAHDPTPPGDQPVWLTGSMVSLGNDKSPVEGVVMWADPSPGLDAHIELAFEDEAKATEIFGQATLGLTALRMSGEADELASAVDLDAKGKMMTVEIHATEDQLAKAMVDLETSAETHAKHDAARGGSGIHFEIETSN